MKVLARYGVRATTALNSEVCDHHPEIIEEALRLGWELMGHGQTNAVRLNEASPEQERDAIFATLDRIERASGVRPIGWLGPGLAETWRTLDYLSEAGVRYVCDWINDDQPYTMTVGSPPMVSLPYSVQTNDAPAYFEMKDTVPEFERTLKAQFDTLYEEGAESGRVMSIAVHPFITGQPHRIGALDARARRTSARTATCGWPRAARSSSTTSDRTSHGRRAPWREARARRRPDVTCECGRRRGWTANASGAAA